MNFATVALAAPFITDIQSEHLPAFMDFLGNHGKTYATKAEFDFRFNLFEQRVVEHKRWNEMPGQTSTQGVNFLTDYTQDEIKNLNGFKESMVGRTKNYKQFEAVEASGPVDWRQKGAVTPVKNQGSCGSCWSFSTTGALEGAHFIKSGDLVSLSESQLMNCSKKNSGCNGGLMDLAFQYAETNPIMPDSDWGYEAFTVPFSCYLRYRKADGIVTVSTYVDVPREQPEQLKAALQVGPVSVAIEADRAPFHQYTGGVISGPECGVQLDHGVLAVGWGTDATAGDYIIVKNSWGPTWGEKGFIRLASASGAGTCGINTSASQPSTN
jgi:xylem cysteine proteinase